LQTTLRLIDELLNVFDRFYHALAFGFDLEFRLVFMPLELPGLFGLGRLGLWHCIKRIERETDVHLTFPRLKERAHQAPSLVTARVINPAVSVQRTAAG